MVPVRDVVIALDAESVESEKRTTTGGALYVAHHFIEYRIDQADSENVGRNRIKSVLRNDVSRECVSNNTAVRRFAGGVGVVNRPEHNRTPERIVADHGTRAGVACVAGIEKLRKIPILERGRCQRAEAA